MFFAAYRRAVRLRREVEADRDFWKKRALDLEVTLQQRSDFFIEREFKMIDRFLTAKVGTFAITDEIRARQNRPEVTDREVYQRALDDFLQEQKEIYKQYAIDANLPDPDVQAQRTLEQQMSSLVANFERDYHHLHLEK